VALVQVASSPPMFLLALPAGALGSRRSWIAKQRRCRY
jgi:hypothetical protein